MRRIQGFTMTELMVAVALSLLTVAAAGQFFSFQTRTYTVVDQTSEAQQNSRAVSDLLEREARHTAFMVPEGAAACGVDQVNGPDTLFVTAAEAVDPTGRLQSNLGADLLVGSASAGTQTLTLSDVTVEGNPFYDTDANGVPDSDFRVGAGVIVADAEDPSVGAACGIVQQVFVAANQIRVLFLNTLAGVPPGDRVVVVPAHVYQVDAQLRLLRDGTVLAPNVEDLQVAYFFDLDGDGQLDAPGEDFGSANGPAYVPGARDHSLLREIRLNVVLRSRDADPNPATGTPVFQATENRAPNLALDGFRRRVQTVTARVRNVGLRSS